MSDTEAAPDKPLPWTDEAKFQFLLRIIAQLRGDGKTMNWTKINLAGRTTKSLQNMWGKINKEISEIEAAENGEIRVTPTKPKPSTPRKGRAKAAEKSSPLVAPDASDDEAEADVKRSANPRKRSLAARSASNSAAKKTKKIASNEETDAMIKDELNFENPAEI